MRTSKHNAGDPVPASLMRFIGDVSGRTYPATFRRAVLVEEDASGTSAAINVFPRDDIGGPWIEKPQPTGEDSAVIARPRLVRRIKNGVQVHAHYRVVNSLGKVQRIKLEEKTGDPNEHQAWTMDKVDEDVLAQVIWHPRRVRR